MRIKNLHSLVGHDEMSDGNESDGKRRVQRRSIREAKEGMTEDRRRGEKKRRKSGKE